MIYEIVCNETGERYVGSTFEPTIAKRMAQHRGKIHKCYSKQIIERGNYSYGLLEKVNVTTRDELRMMERKWYDKLDCINKNKPYRTEEEAKEGKKEYDKEYSRIKRETQKHPLDIYNKNSRLYDNYNIFNGLDNLYPVNWINCVTEFIEKPYENYKTIIREYQPLVVLVNSVYNSLEDKTVKEIVEGNMPITYFINKSFENINYNAMINSTEFTYKLSILNDNLKESLLKHNFIPILIGNLFYDHAQPEFYNSCLLYDCHEKRVRFSKACSMRNTMFEIGLNGGHSAFLALMSNKNLQIYSNDIAEFYPPCPTIHPEIYVQIAADTLKTMFNNRFTFIKGNCLSEVVKFVKNNPNVKFDILHIDGEKGTYKRDFLNLIPSLNEDAIIIFDDSNMESVQNMVDELMNDGYLHRVSDFPQMNPNIKYRNEILIYKNKHKIIFENIYEKQLWNNCDPNIPLSGPGSSFENTKDYSNMLTKFIYDNECKSVLDLGCGDLNWIPKTKFFNDNGIKYTGVDVVDRLIDSHLINFPEKHFLCKDITMYNYFDKVDIIIIRDVIFHLKNNEQYAQH